MTKKDRSPTKPQASPNPRPRRRNKKQRDTMPQSKKKESPVGTPINTPINTPERATLVANSFSALHADSDTEDKSVDTINAKEPQIEIESETDDQPISITSSEEFQPSSRQSFNPASTPEKMKDSGKSTGLIVAIPPTEFKSYRNGSKRMPRGWFVIHMARVHHVVE
jgi:hypothetical protein